MKNEQEGKEWRSRKRVQNHVPSFFSFLLFIEKC